MIDWNAPEQTGVYIFRSKQGEVLYVGKANSLSSRLAHYRSALNALESGGHSDSPKTSLLVKEADSLEVIACRNEADALVLENTLIKQHKPKFNIALKESVYYAYLKITNEEFPRILTVRKRDVSRGEKLIGPFVSGRGRGVALRETMRAFGIRTCTTLPDRACLQYHLGFCSGPCIGKISKEEYAENVRKAEAVLRGKTEEVEKLLEGEMKSASQRKDYERALQLRERLQALLRIKQKQLMETQASGNEDFFGFVLDGELLRCCVLNSRSGVIVNRDNFIVDAIGESPKTETIMRYYETHAMPKKVFAAIESGHEAEALAKMLSNPNSGVVAMGPQLVVPERGDKLELVKLAEKNAGLATGVAASSIEAISLQKSLGLYRPPATIDCFDVSNLAGRQVVGSCVRLTDGKPDKKNYRRFKITGLPGQDDFASMQQIVYRRYAGVLRKQEKLPDFILIDGGPGQLHAAMNALGELGVEVSIAALAKKEEELYLPDLLAPLKLPHSNAGLKLLMRCRDEAHRFALKYNRKRRKMESGY